MIISFCGHAQFLKNDNDKDKILNFLKKTVGDQEADIYLGGYGNFDAFAYSCCKKYKENHPRISLIFITPYIPIKHDVDQFQYDDIIYPGMENRPLKYAIYHRNKWMMEKADYVIAYINHDWGGAYTAYKHAKRKGKVVFNLGELKD